MGVGDGGGGVVGGRCVGRGGGLGDCEGEEGAVICLAGWREYLYIMLDTIQRLIHITTR